ncbi:heparinase II/III family protein [Limimaricola pyoseonensis]|uniref:Uncharacterized conserved protein, heparinase superfamily n=1 Tax=Limimaricola pyoseonensis TaxID=521013 RepID=A0A1G7E8M3_9RHOB|nr:heparinase II/III family protein [Limimaricola pyoseonensis]SDE60007.1 Uncharacterized conserved protein, heparinase superfamily [Limimaricola pyoseonensis]
MKLSGITHAPGRLGRWLTGRRDRLAVPETFRWTPEPEGSGDAGRGQALLAGRVAYGGQIVEARGRAPWSLGPEDGPHAARHHDFAWLDDLAALGGPQARGLARSWVADWITRYEGGRGPGWAPETVARRIGRLIGHARFLIEPDGAALQASLMGSLAAQADWLSRRWPETTPGVERVVTLAGLIEALAALGAPAARLGRLSSALDRAAAEAVAEDGGVAARCPERLLDTLVALTAAARALEAVGLSAGAPVRDAAARMVPALRALRHTDGALARFHGGGRGAPGRLDRALADSGERAGPRQATARMGFWRLAAGRSSVVLDAAPPPGPPHATEAHASTLAFELTSGLCPVVVNSGSGVHHGPDWRRAGRATPSHSTLCLDGVSSARLGPPTAAGAEPMGDGPRDATAHRTDDAAAWGVEASHDGWRLSHGLTHARRLALARDGACLAGEDLLTTLGPADERRFDAAIRADPEGGIAFTLRFHLHPEVSAEADPDGWWVALDLGSGERWVFRHDGGAHLALAPSVYLEATRPRPVPSRQVVLSGRAMAYATRVRWSLEKAGAAAGTPPQMDQEGPHT